MDWRFALNDNFGNIVSEGMVSNSDLVRELIDQARKNSLSVSVHQHIHNHYGTVPSSLSTQSQSLSGEILSQLSPFAFSGDRTDKLSNGRGFDTDFLGKSPNYASLPLDPQNEPVAQNRALSQNFPVLPMYTQRSGPTSSVGSRSTPGAELEDIPPHRQYHFNYLPATVRPQLGSSEAGRSPQVGKISNRSPAAQPKRKKRRKGKDGSSEGNTPNENYGSTGTTPRESEVSPSNERHSKQGSLLTPGGASAAGEEDGLDFWESLRSLASVPSNARNNMNEGPLDEYEYLYNFYEEQAEVSGENEILNKKPAPSQHQMSSNQSMMGYTPQDPDLIHKGLPYNPS